VTARHSHNVGIVATYRTVTSVQMLRAEWGRARHSSLGRNAVWMFLGQGLSIICQGAYIILLGRLLGITEYGTYVGAAAMVSIVSQYSPLGSHSVFLRYVSPDPEKFAHYWGNVLVTTITLGSLFVVLLAWIGPHLAHSYSWPLLLCVAIGDCLCAQLTTAAGRVFQAFEKMRITAGLNVLVNLLRTLLAGFMLWHFHHGTAWQWAVAALIVSSIAAVIAVALVTRLYGKPALSVPLLRRRTGEGFVFALSYSTTGIYNDIDKVMLGHYGMNAANGIYTMAYRAVDVCTTPITAIQGAAFPRFFRKGVDGVRTTADYSVRLVKRTAPLALISALVMVLVAPILPHLVGRGFGESVLALRWLCLLPFFRSFQLSAGDALTASGHQNLRLGSQVIAAVFNFGTNLYLIPLYSWRGAAWSSLATDGLLAVVNWMVLWWLTTNKNNLIGIEHPTRR
jgi:O-antigen/teichoic acid export membrane protein